MDKPICAQKSPYVLTGEKKKYAWCMREYLPDGNGNGS